MERPTSDEVYSTFIVDYERFGRVSVSVGEQVFIYRRLQDAYDKSLVAVVNERNDPIGYLDREFAMTHVIPSLRKGIRFECVIDGEPSENGIPLKVRPVAQSEVESILSRHGFRRSRTDGVSPLAGLFDADDMEELEEEVPLDDIEDELPLFDEGGEDLEDSEEE